MVELPADLDKRIGAAIAHFWKTRTQQTKKQGRGQKKDQGERSAVTGGAQMDGFMDIVADLVCRAGIRKATVYKKKSLELPGFFRPNKQWDFLVVSESKELLAVIEAKSQVGPSFGNNFNNRTEEAMGSALDLWTAYREGAFEKSPKPWMGYIFLLEKCPSSEKPVRNIEPHFKVFPEFRNASYAKRYELFCRKLVREGYYSASTFLMSDKEDGLTGQYIELVEDLNFEQFARSLMAHVGAYAK